MIEILEKILINKLGRKKLIKDFQNSVWNNNSSSIDERLRQVLSELAYDFDFYEPDEELRKEDPSFYGDERLEEEIKSALQRLNSPQ